VNYIVATKNYRFIILLKQPFHSLPVAAIASLKRVGRLAFPPRLSLGRVRLLSIVSNVPAPTVPVPAVPVLVQVQYSWQIF
jgi:hypothetical protein